MNQNTDFSEEIIKIMNDTNIKREKRKLRKAKRLHKNDIKRLAMVKR